jgi:hypothetical protein
LNAAASEKSAILLSKGGGEYPSHLSGFMEHARTKVFDKEPSKGLLDDKVQSIADEIKNIQKFQKAARSEAQKVDEMNRCLFLGTRKLLH